jgi:UDPglucose--hexose-1-phosphate uridylyltransferase
MGFIRKDYLLERYVYYAIHRGTRPREFEKSVETHAGTDFFAPGNEHLTPPEKGRVQGPRGWLIRWFDNKFAAVEQQGSFTLKGNLAQSSNYGVHEVIVETPAQGQQLSDLPVVLITALLRVYAHRIGELSKIKGVKYVMVFKNHGSEAGTSLLHEHSQAVALPHVPPAIREEARASASSRISPYLAIAKKEIKTKRGIAQNKSFVAFCPFASRFNYEAWIFPKRTIRTFDDFKEYDYENLATLLKKILLRLKSIGASYNFYIHYAPKGSNLPFHVEITPRIATWGGFELGSGCVINSVLPEDAAAFYREKP